MDTVIAIAYVLSIFYLGSLVIGVLIVEAYLYENVPVIESIKESTYTLFYKRNLFGIIISSIIFIYMIPICLIVLIPEFIKFIFSGKLFVYIWELGNKK